MLASRTVAMLFVVEADASGRASWRLLDVDRRVVASGGHSFASLGLADQAAHDFRVGAPETAYAVRGHDADRWSWAAWRPDGTRVAVSSGQFPDELSARSAAEGVRHALATAIGP